MPDCVTVETEGGQGCVPPAVCMLPIANAHATGTLSAAANHQGAVVAQDLFYDQ